MKYNLVKKIQVGSSVFFESIKGFSTKDTDWFALYDNVPGDNFMMNVKIGKDDIFIYKANVTKDDMIEEALNAEHSLKVGKFLSPEFASYYNVTIDDLKKLEEKFNLLDEKHQYQKTIFEYYIKNNGLFLTDSQRLKAFGEYIRGKMNNGR